MAQQKNSPKPKTPTQRPLPATHSRVPHAQLHAGKLYRVRDKDTAEAAGRVWGQNLKHADAVKLKNKVAGERKSRTVRIEEMTTPRPSPAQLADMQAPARAAAARMAAEANERQRLRELAAQAPEPEGGDEGDLLEGDDEVDPNELGDILDDVGNLPDQEEISRAEQAAAKPATPTR